MDKGKRTEIAGQGRRLHGNRRAAVLLDQQMWCWGRDVVRSEGNLLLQVGFRKERPPAGVSGSTAYVLTPFPGGQLVLWGFGLYLGLVSSGGMFLRRDGFDPGRLAGLAGGRLVHGRFTSFPSTADES